MNGSVGVQLVANGVIVGALYALIASAISLTYIQQRVIFLAHGATAAVAGYALVELLDRGLAWQLAVPLAVAMAAVVGVGLLSVGGWNVAHSEQAQALMFLLGLILLLVVQNALLWIFDAGPRVIGELVGAGRLGGSRPLVTVTGDEGFVVVLALVTYGLLLLLLDRSRFGLLVRAVGESPTLSVLRGMRPRRIVLASAVVASVCAAVAGVGSAALQNVEPTIGLALVLKGMAAALIGGVRIHAALLAGLGIGIVESVATYGLPGGYREAIVFGLLALFLLVRPHGLSRRAARADAKA